ncbi:hypothetical protein HDK90DRAFT_508220 [Phyllosticta capitalensis]|uniref:Uncharacterized protein n=1 Tax=Phyllosticta capitalensis TaxID=121624 RepID=A0ABR1Z0M6_9PEZI
MHTTKETLLKRSSSGAAAAYTLNRTLLFLFIMAASMAPSMATSSPTELHDTVRSRYPELHSLVLSKYPSLHSPTSCHLCAEEDLPDSDSDSASAEFDWNPWPRPPACSCPLCAKGLPGSGAKQNDYAGKHVERGAGPILRVEGSDDVDEPVSRAEENDYVDEPVSRAEENDFVDEPVSRAEENDYADEPISRGTTPQEYEVTEQDYWNQVAFEESKRLEEMQEANLQNELDEEEEEEGEEEEDDSLQSQLDAFQDQVASILRERLSEAANDPMLDALPQFLRWMIRLKCGVEIVALFQEGESILRTVNTETAERIGAILADLWWSEDIVAKVKQAWYDPKRIYADKLKKINKFATAYKHRLGEIEMNSAVSEKWGDGWREKLRLDTMPPQPIKCLYSLACYCKNLAVAVPDWDQARALLNFSLYSRLNLLALGKLPTWVNRKLRVCLGDVKKAAQMARSQRSMRLPELKDPLLSQLFLRYNEHGVLFRKDDEQDGLPWRILDDTSQEMCDKLNEDYAEMEKEGWAKRWELNGKRRAASDSELPTAKRLRTSDARTRRHRKTLEQLQQSE